MRLTALGPPPQVRRLAAANLANSLGDGMFAAVSAVFFIDVVGLSAGSVTRGLAAGAMLALLIGIPIGILGDRIGAKPVYVTLLLLEGLAVAGYTLVEGPSSFVALAVVAVAANRSAPGVRNGLIAALTPPEIRTRTRAYLRSVTNAGTAVGAGLGGLALIAPARAPLSAVLVIDGLTFAVAAAVVAGVTAPVTSRTGGSTAPMEVLRDRTFLLASTGQALLSLNTLILTLALPLWILTRTDASPSVVGMLIVGSTILTVGLQVPASRLADTPRAAVRSSCVAGLLVAAACLTIAPTYTTTTSVTVTLLAIAAAVRVLGEVLQVAGGWTMSFTAPPAGRACTYQATYSTAFTAAAAAGPLLVGGVVSRHDASGWLTAAGVFAALGTLTALASAAVMRNQRTAALRQLPEDSPTPDVRTTPPA